MTFINAGAASLPLPRMIDRYATPDLLSAAMSLTKISDDVVPSISAILASRLLTAWNSSGAVPALPTSSA